MEKNNNYPVEVLVVVDMQNDFIDGALGTKEAQSIVSNVYKKIEAYRSSGGMVVFTRDTHYCDYSYSAEGRKLPVEHCIKDTEGWQITSEIQVLENEKIINKPTFGSLELAEMLDEYNISSIELVGLCTDICVISNALILKAKFPEISIEVDSSCCAGVTPESHENALNAMKMCQIDII